jgi:hypothetical protein
MDMTEVLLEMITNESDKEVRLYSLDQLNRQFQDSQVFGSNYKDNFESLCDTVRTEIEGTNKEIPPVLLRTLQEQVGILVFFREEMWKTNEKEGQCERN